MGFKFEIKHISGKKYVINNNDGKVIKNNFVKRVPQLGLRKKVGNGGIMKGNLLILFEVEEPDRLSEEVRDKLKEIL